MKFLALALSLCMTLNVLAASGTTIALERELDAYQYAMTVDWDQNDQIVYEKETKAFFDKLGTLVAEKGLTKSELLAMAEKKMANKVAFDALKLKLSLMGNVKSSDELALVLRDSSKEFYSQGASWSGDVGTYLVGAAVVALIAYAVWFNAKYECIAYDERWDCDTHVYEHRSSTTCGWRSYCSAYSEK